MVTSSDCLKKYGHPANPAPWMIVLVIPELLRVGKVPKRVYCNKDLSGPLLKAFENLIQRGFISELKTWDGCFNIRPMTGGSGNYSLHSWGIAVDLNASENGYGVKPKLSAGFVKCFTDAGFDWGGTWRNPDGMHFQLSKI